MELEGYDVGLVCENGHEVNAASRGMPESNAKFCKDCGARTSTNVRHARRRFEGTLWGGGGGGWHVPAFCHECGTPYPWTKSALEAAEELVRFSEKLNEEEKEALVAAVKDATVDTPRTKVAVEKIKRYGAKLGTEAFKTLREILTDIASEYTKKTLGL